MDSLAFLERIERAKLAPLYVLHGDEAFLKRRVLQALQVRVLGSERMGVSTHAGDKATFAEVYDELQTMPFFSSRRVVVVENADPFVTRYRALLEQKVRLLPETGMLVLEVKSWPANTRLAKLIADEATIVCKTPPAFRLPTWCIEWAKAQYGKQVGKQAAGLLVELIGAEMGQLQQELFKLAIYVGDRPAIETEDVDRLVGHSRAENTWKIFDAIAAGQSDRALAILDRLFEQGEEPLRILGAFSMQLRRLARAARLAKQGLGLTVALEQAGVPPFGLRGAEQQLRHLGKARTDRLYDRLLQIDLGMKGGSSLPPRSLLERFVIDLARDATASTAIQPPACQT